MAVRRESVRLELDDQFTTGMARAAAATALLNRNLKDLDGSSVRVGDGLADAAVGADRLGSSSRRGGPEIDKLSGRLRLLRDAAIVLGPALVPLGAATIPVLTGSIAALGAASGGLGAAILAFNGLGDAMKAIDEYELEPTAANLEKLRLEQEKLGPAGAEFLAYLDDIEPQLKSLQLTAREGLLPGVEEGIDNLLTRLPQVRRIVGELSEGMGDLARDAGDSLASERWDPFFSYVEHEARPTLDAFAKSTGNVALGVANLLVAFAPLSGDLTGGLEDMTARFAEWSEGLDSNEGFQEFLAYVNESGPQALDLLGSIATMFGGIIQAAAPIGSAVLPVVAALAKVIGTLAGTPIGGAFLTAAVALRAYSRAAQIATVATTGLSGAVRGLSGRQVAGGLGLLAVSLTDVDDKLGLTNTAMLGSAGLLAGPWGAAIGAGIGLTLDLNSAQDSLNDSLERSQDIARSGTHAEQRAELRQLRQELDDTKDAQEEFWDLGSSVSSNAAAVKGWIFGTRQQKDAVLELRGAMRQGGGIADLFGASIGRSGNQMRLAAGDAQALSSALAILNGWLDKQQALINYREALAGLREGLKDGFTPEDRQNLVDYGQSMIQVANTMKDKDLRADFLAGARTSLRELAETSGPKARRVIDVLIDRMGDLGKTEAEPEVNPNTKPAEQKFDRVKADMRMLGASRAEPVVDADKNPFAQAYGQTKREMRLLDAARANPKITADAGSAFSIFGQVRDAMRALDGDTATTYVRTVRTGGFGPDAKPSAGGGTVPKSGRGYADRYPYMLADGEEVISNRHGQADRHRALLKAINANQMLAGGGTAGSTYTARRGNESGHFMSELGPAVRDVAQGFKSLKERLADARDALKAEQQARRDFASQVGGAFAKADPFAGGLADFDLATAANTNDTSAAQAALAAASGKGLDGALYKALAASGNLQLVQEFANLSRADIRSKEVQFSTQSGAQATLGNAAADVVFGVEVRHLRKVVDRLERRLANLGEDVERGTERGSEKGSRNGTRDRDRNTAAQVRTQPRPLARKR